MLFRGVGGGTPTLLQVLCSTVKNNQHITQMAIRMICEMLKILNKFTRVHNRVHDYVHMVPWYPL